MKKLYLVKFVLLIFLIHSCKLNTENKTTSDEPETETIDSVGIASESDDEIITIEEEHFKEMPSYFQYMGRTAPDKDGRLLIGSASSVRFRAKGDTLKLRLNTVLEEHAYIAVTLDDTFSYKYQLKKKGDSDIAVPLGNVDDFHEITVYKLTEAVTGGVIFEDAQAEELVASEFNPNLKIEFIGNSITCGMGADAREIPCGQGEWYDQHNAYLSYASRVGRKLKADYRISAVSGRGIYRNWNDETEPVVPELYGSLNLDGDMDHPLDYNNFQPDLISICLGTNDMSEGDGTKERAPFDPEEFTQKYIEFVTFLLSKYPEARIALLASPMVKGEGAVLLSECLGKVKREFEDDHYIEIFEFSDIEPHGCGYHPDLNDQDEMADELMPFYIGLLDKGLAM
ncbi:SGNH/GDSL hydrolase family protein [Robertkochia solimangrovi]|uniref:SGNH/GDSL hydrolase family protein n=1 Tax=Robertkochia solimangrovi TaxID=2213046 RepID=UPI0013A55D4D|nr:SGNH/GDSL hydrolase family protein [Robertkochia solimangrovi]